MAGRDLPPNFFELLSNRQYKAEHGSRASGLRFYLRISREAK